MSLYTREEINEFVAHNLEVVGEYSADKIEQIRRDFADTITLLPAAHQSILIETQRLNVTGDFEQVQKLYQSKQGTIKGVNGFFSPGTFGDQKTLSGHFNNCSEADRPAKIKDLGEDAIVWADTARGKSGQITARHEHGHRVDYLIGRNEYWSDKHQGWRDAVMRQVESEKLRVEGASKRTPLTWLQQRVAANTSALYQESRELLDHLNLYTGDESYAREAMAEISNHHYSLHALYLGDQNKVDSIMNAKYPELWPIYQKDYMPAVEQYSNELQNKRFEAIDGYVAKQKELCQIAGRNFDGDEATWEASLAAARGTLADEDAQLASKLRLYNDPVGWYQNAEQSLLKARWNLAQDHEQNTGMDSFFEFDEKASRAYAQKIMDTQGFDALLDSREEIISQMKLLQRLEWGYRRQEYTYAQLEERDPETPWGSAVLESFDRLMKDGGAQRVLQEIDYLMLPAREVVNYARSAERLEFARLELQTRDAADKSAVKEYSFDVRQFIVAIEDLRGPNAKEKIRQADEQTKEKIRSLQKCEMSHDLYASRLNTAFGFEIAGFTGEGILQIYDELWEQGGKKAVQDKARKLYIKQNDLNNYVIAAENLVDEYWEIEYGLADKKTKAANPVKYDHQGMLEELQKISDNNAAETLPDKIKEMRDFGRHLKRLENAYRTFEENMGVITDSSPDYSPGGDIIAKYHDLIQTGGFAAVNDEIERLRVPVGALQRYASAVESLEYCRWEVLYPTQVRQKANPFEVNKTLLVNNVESMLGPDVKTQLEDRTAELRRQQRALLKVINGYENVATYQPQSTQTVSLNALLANHDYFSEQLSMASWQIRAFDNVELSESFYEIAALLTSQDYTTKGLPSSGPHTPHQQVGFTLRDHLGGAIGRMLSDGGLNREDFGGLKSWQRLRLEVGDLVGDDPKLIKLFKSFEVNLFEAAAQKHRNVTSLAQTADPIASAQGAKLLSQFDMVQRQLKEDMFAQMAADTSDDKNSKPIGTRPN